MRLSTLIYATGPAWVLVLTIAACRLAQAIAG